MPDFAALRGRRIVVTRTGEAGIDFAARLRSCGAEPILAPTIAILPPDNFGPLDAAIATLDRYDGIIFTSANAVRAFLDRLTATGNDLSALDGLRCGAIGPATATALADAGRAPEIVPDTHTAEALAAGFGEVAGQRFFVPAADIARPTLAEDLRSRGAQVDVVTAYRTVAAAPDTNTHIGDLIRDGAIDAVTFTSPSTVHGFLGAVAVTDLRAACRRPAIICIGPTTAEAARTAGLPVDSIAAEHSADSLIAALIAYFATHPTLAHPHVTGTDLPTQGA